MSSRVAQSLVKYQCARASRIPGGLQSAQVCVYPCCMLPPPTDEITTRQALELLGLTEPSTISRYVVAGKLTPSRKLPGRTGAFMFWRHDVLRLRASRTNGAA